ncbi:hypothetical protein ACA910_014094 [Epithemia clementina (nom. ined.)]
MDFTPNQHVKSFHGAPRFGFPKEMVVLFSDNQSDKDEYINGLLLFSILVLFLSLVWISILLVLKTKYGVSRVGCAAGGEPIYVSKLRENGVRRWERRQRMERSWATQNIFLICCFGIPAFSAVVLNQGLNPLLVSLNEVSGTASLFRDKALLGIDIAKRLHSDFNNIRFYSRIGVDDICPNRTETGSGSIGNLANAWDGVHETIERLDSFIVQGTGKFVRSMLQVVEASDGVIKGTAEIEKNDWIAYLLLGVLNGITFFLALGALLAKNQMNHIRTQQALSFVVLPTFFLTLLGVIIYTCIVAPLAVINADFCAGGTVPNESSIGTLQEFCYLQGYDDDSVLVRSLHYFSYSNCEGQYPLFFMFEINISLENTIRRMQGILNQNGLIDAQCGDTRLLETIFAQVSQGLAIVSDNLQSALESTTCSSVRPLMEDLAVGATCNDSINSFTWLFSALTALIVLCLIIMSTRAAMFNPVIPTNKKKRREKEFRLYKEFITVCGYDTADWKLDGDRKQFTAAGVPICKTFETESTSSVGGRLTIACGEGSNHYDEDSPSSRSFSDTSAARECLTTIREENLVEADEVADDSSAFSFDSDDSSIQRPPSVMLTVASNFTNLVQNLLSPRNNSGQSHGTGDRSPSQAEPGAPTSPVRLKQYRLKIVSLIQCGHDPRKKEEEDFMFNSVVPSAPIEPASPSAPQQRETQPRAPQKEMHAFPRTILSDAT